MRDQYRHGNIAYPISIREPASEFLVDNKLNNADTLKTLHMLISMLKLLILFV